MASRKSPIKSHFCSRQFHFFVCVCGRNVEQMPKEKTGSFRLRNGKLYVRLTFLDERGKRREITKQVANRSEGKRAIRESLAKLRGGGAGAFDTEKRTFSDLADFYLTHHAVAPVYAGDIRASGLRSYPDVRQRVKALCDYFARMRLQTITYQHLVTYKRARLSQPVQRTGKPRTLADVHRSLAILRSMFNVAIREGWLPSNPFARGRNLISTSIEKPRERVLTPEEEAKLLKMCEGHHLHTFLIFLLDTGCRRGEALSLEWRCVDFQSSVIRIEAQNSKTNRARCVPLSTRLRRELLEVQNSTAIRVFPHSAPHLHTKFTAICKALGIANLRFHDLRHTYATRLAQAGLPLHELARLLGHTNVTTTFRYCNNQTDTLERAATLLNKINSA